MKKKYLIGFAWSRIDRGRIMCVNYFFLWNIPYMGDYIWRKKADYLVEAVYSHKPVQFHLEEQKRKEKELI